MSVKSGSSRYKDVYMSKVDLRNKKQAVRSTKRRFPVLDKMKVTIN